MKTKTIAAVIAIFILTGVTVSYYFQQKNESQSQLAQQSFTGEKSGTNNENSEKTVDGEVISINEKQIHLKLSDGKGSAIYIEPKVPVRVENADDNANLSNLKIGTVVSVVLDDRNVALSILIKK